MGDLICYNAAGMKEKTLGLVLEISHPKSWYSGLNSPIALVQWCIVGKMMPRKDHDKEGYFKKEIDSGDFCWHPVGDWFEVVK